jgi:CHASE2 domain-containing sensor protein
MSSFARTRLRRGAGLGLCSAAVVWLLVLAGPLPALDTWARDLCFRLRGGRQPVAKIVLVNLDGASLDALNKPAAYLSPEMAEVVTHLKAQGAAAIGIDLLVVHTDRPDPEVEREGGRGDARPMGRAVAEAGNVVLAKWQEAHGWKLPLLQWRLKSLLAPAPTDLAFINLTPDDDHVIRRQALLVRDGNDAIPQFALAVYCRARGVSFAWDGDRRELRVGEEVVPLDARQELAINFAGPPGRFPVLSFRDVLAAHRQGRPLPAVNGAVVLVGATAPGLADFHATPYSPELMSGIELQANVLATLHDRAFLRAPLASLPAWLRPLPGLLVLGAVLGAALAWLRPVAGAVLAGAFLALWPGASFAAFAGAGLQVAVAGPLTLTLLTLAAVFLFRKYLSKWPPLEGYRLLSEEPLERGGQAEVYKALHIRLNREVALKKFGSTRKNGDEAARPRPRAVERRELERFRREAEALARMHHANIVSILDLGEHEGRPTLVLEWMEGGSLAQQLARREGGKLPVKEAVGLAATLARAVAYAHQRGFCHRDLKLTNVLLTATGAPKISDFGLAKRLVDATELTEAGVILGTPRWWAPEQAAGRSREAGPAADIYALGVILFRLLTGEFPRTSPGGDVFPPSLSRPEVSPELDLICMNCLQQDPASRYRQAWHLTQALWKVYGRL